MSTTNYTPGPWMVKGRVHSSGEAIRVESHHAASEHHLYQVADVLDANGYPQNQANLLLIVTAPDMLEKLEQALEFVADHEDVIDGDNGPLPNRAMALAAELRAVIAKATGSAS